MTYLRVVRINKRDGAVCPKKRNNVLLVLKCLSPLLNPEVDTKA